MEKGKVLQCRLTRYVGKEKVHDKNQHCFLLFKTIVIITNLTEHLL